MNGSHGLIGTTVVVVFLCAVSCLAAQSEPPRLVGRWEGAIYVNRGALPFSVTFTAPAGELTGTIDVKRHKASPLNAISVSGGRVHFELQAARPATAVFDGSIEGDTISGFFTQGRARGTFSLTRADVTAASTAATPYRTEEATFVNGGVVLTGTLTLPKGKGPFPGVVMVSGSGAQNRDQELFGFRIFAEIADHLAHHGIATLRYDDRGVGGSTGNLAASTMQDLAGDTLAGVAVLANHPEIDRRRVGLLGHSEGASVAALAGLKSPEVAFIVMMAPAAVRGDALIERQMAHAARANGATPQQVATMLKAFRKVLEAVRSEASSEVLESLVREQIAAQYYAQAPDAAAALGDKTAFVDKILPGALAQIRSVAMRDLIDFDPQPVLSGVRCPTLALFGGKDVQVPPDLNRQALEAAFSKGGHTEPTVITYADANHLFMAARTGQPSEYVSLARAFVPGLLDDLTRWISALP